jgi:hypothetical protein
MHAGAEAAVQLWCYVLGRQQKARGEHFSISSPLTSPPWNLKLKRIYIKKDLI